MKYCIKCHYTFDESVMSSIGDFSVCSTCSDKIKNSTPREYTEDEIREKLIKHFIVLQEYWEELDDKTTQERMSGMLFSILAALDGSSIDIPAFKIIPITDPSDKDFHKSLGENWYPETDVDIGGGLHEILHKFEPTIKRNRKRKINKINKKS